MNWLQFIEGMTGHILSLPVVLLVLLLMLRKHVGPLVARLLKVNIWGTEITLGASVDEGKKIIDRSPPLPQLTDDSDLSPELEQGKAPSLPEPIDRGRGRTRDSKWVQPNLQGIDLWNTTAAGQIISGFEAVEAKVLEIGKTMGFEPSNGIDELMIMGALSWKNAISADMFALYKTLLDGRNLIAQARALPSPDETLDYVRQAAYLLATLTNLKHRIDRGQVKL
jgi:hypothetical protein